MLDFYNLFGDTFSGVTLIVKKMILVLNMLNLNILLFDNIKYYACNIIL